MANPKLTVEIEADIKGMEAALSRADALLKQHQNNYKNVQAAIGQNTQRSRELDKSLQNLNSQFKAGAVSEGQFAKESDRLSAELREISNETNDYQRELRRLDSEMDRVAASTRNYQQAAQSTTRATGQQAKATQQMARTTKANAVPAMTSFSQVVQDAPYGIQGVANNIQMLTQQMGYLSAQAGGARGALSAMVGTLMGPTGILLGVSLVTTALVTYGDEILNAVDSTNRLKEATQGYIGEAMSEVSNLRVLIGVANNHNASIVARRKAIDEINNKYSDYLGNLNLEKIGTKETREAVDRLTKSLIQQAQVRGLQDIIGEETTKFAERTTELQIRQRELYGDIRKELKEMSQTGYWGKVIRDSDDVVGSLRAIQKTGEEAPVGLRTAVGTYQEVTAEIKEVGAEAERALEPYRELQKALQEKIFSFSAVPEFSQDAIEIKGKGSKDDPVTVYTKAELVSDPFQGDYTLEGTAAGILDEELIGNAYQQHLRDQINSTVETIQEADTEINKVATSVDRAFQGMISGMVNSLIQGEFKVEDFVKNIASSLASIALTSMLGPVGGIFGGLFSKGGIVPQSGVNYAGAFSTGGMIGGNSFSGDKLWALVNSGEMVLNRNQQKALYSGLTTPTVAPMSNDPIPITGSTRIDGQDLIVVYERAEKRRGRTT